MKAALLYGPGDMRMVEQDVPRPGADEVVVRVVSYAPYGTDIACYLNRQGRYVSSYPTGVGADFSGTVHEVGSSVPGFAPGDRVSALALSHCGECGNCIAGYTNRCLDARYREVDRQVCCQEYALVQARKLAKLPAAMAFDDAAMLAGIVDALNARDLVRPLPGEAVAVIGVGAMGWGAIATFRALGFAVLAIGGTGRRAELARDIGARVIALRAHGDIVTEQVLGERPQGYPVIMETTATDWGVQQSLAIAAVGGRVALTGGNALNLTVWDLIGKELTLVGVRAGHHQKEALDLVASGKIDLKPTVTHRFDLADAPEAFALLAGPGGKDVGRVMISC